MQHIAHIELSKINLGLLLENLKKVYYLKNPGFKQNMILKVIRFNGSLLTGPRTRTSCGLLSFGVLAVTILS